MPLYVLVATCVPLLLAACGTQAGEASGTTGTSVPATLSDIRVINPGMVAVDFVVENTTASSGSVECEVSVIDPDGAAKGSEVTTIPDVAAEAQQAATVLVQVNAEGAEFVTEASVECRVL